MKGKLDRGCKTSVSQRSDTKIRAKLDETFKKRVDVSDACEMRCLGRGRESRFLTLGSLHFFRHAAKVAGAARFKEKGN